MCSIHLVAPIFGSSSVSVLKVLFQFQFQFWTGVSRSVHLYMVITGRLALVLLDVPLSVPPDWPVGAASSSAFYEVGQWVKWVFDRSSSSSSLFHLPIIFFRHSLFTSTFIDSPTRCLFQCWNKYYLACYRGPREITWLINKLTSTSLLPHVTSQSGE